MTNNGVLICAEFLPQCLVEFELSWLFAKGGFKSEDTGEFLHLQDKHYPEQKI